MSGLVHRIQRALADPLSRDDVIDPMQELSALLRDVERQTTAEIAVVTVSSLDGMTVEDYASRLFKAWGVGKKGHDNRAQSPQHRGHLRSRLGGWRVRRRRVAGEGVPARMARGSHAARLQSHRSRSRMHVASSI